MSSLSSSSSSSSTSSSSTALWPLNEKAADAHYAGRHLRSHSTHEAPRRSMSDRQPHVPTRPAHLPLPSASSSSSSSSSVTLTAAAGGGLIEHQRHYGQRVKARSCIHPAVKPWLPVRLGILTIFRCILITMQSLIFHRKRYRWAPGSPRRLDWPSSFCFGEQNCLPVRMTMTSANVKDC